jgi:hypothetical protein
MDAQIRFQNRNNKREDGNKVRLSAWNNLFKE